MMMLERIQNLIHKLEVGAGARWLNYLVLALLVLALAVWYDTHCYHGFNAPEAMDAAQVGRNLAEGRGFSTECVRPFSLYLVQQHNGATAPGAAGGPADPAKVYSPHPDLANAPLYPAVLAGIFKITSPEWKVDLKKAFWGGGGQFKRYKPEFVIAIFNQLLLLVAVVMTFFLARAILDQTAAYLSAILMLGSDRLWKFSVSGLPTLLLLVIFLGLVWCLVRFEREGGAEKPDERLRFRLALGAGALAGLGALTQYSFGWVIVPLFVYLMLFGGQRRVAMALALVLIFAAVIAPWILRNVAVSGTLFGTAGYAVAEDTMGYPGSRLMQSINPSMAGMHSVLPFLLKFGTAMRALLQNNIPRIGGGWVGCLFLAGLLLALRNVVARRLRNFVLMCLGVFLVATAMGETPMGTWSGETNAENLLVLLIPPAIIFGVAFFLTLLDQMELPVVPLRYLIMGVVMILGCQQFMFTLLPPKSPLLAFPPYYPPDIQKLSGWIRPDEMMMSDIPWAVAWYGHRQCVWTTVNADSDFFKVNDDIKHVSGLYLSQPALDSRLLSDCLQGESDSWPRFVFERLAFDNIKTQDAADLWGRAYFKSSPNELKKTFPLNSSPIDEISSGLFLADRKRW